MTSLSLALAARYPQQITNQNQILLGSAAVVAVILLLGEVTQISLIGLVWVASLILFVATPVFVLRYSRYNTKFAHALLHSGSAACFAVGIYFVSQGKPEEGALLYFFMMILVPATTLVFLIESLNESTIQLTVREERLNHLYNNVGEVFFETDLLGNLTNLSASIAQYGYDRQELIGKPLTYLFVENLEIQHNLENAESETIKDMPVLLKAHNRDEIAFEFSATSNLHVNDSKIVGSLRNVQERKILELQFLESQRRESLGTLAGGVAHDFNNILQSIIIHAELALRERKVDQKTTARLDVIIDSASSAASLCHQLLQYTGTGYRHRVPVNLDEVINNVLQILVPSCPAGITLDYESSPSNRRVEGDPAQLHQVLLNVIKNAIDAIPHRGSVLVILQSASPVSVEAPHFTLGSDDTKNKGTVSIEVRDSGVGIKPENLGKIFDPFFSTKAEGYGLGLSAVTGILKSHNGILKLWTYTNIGTTVQISFPSTDVTNSESGASEQPPEHNHHTVLVAEDNASIREGTSQMLQSYGHKVLTASNGQEAISVFQRNPDISLLITDVRMPVLDGIDAAREIQNIRHVPVILVSGYGEVTKRLNERESNEFVFLQKPFHADDLRSAIDAAFSPMV